MDDRYTDTHIADLWSRYHTIALWARVEAEAAMAQARQGLIPRDAAHAIRAGLDKMVKHLEVPELHRALILSLDATEADVRHDVVAFLRCASEFIDQNGRDWLHFGLTSSDLVDSANSIRLQHADTHIYHLVESLSAVLAQGVIEHVRTPMLGRTHGQPAEPTTLGVRFHQWRENLDRALNRANYLSIGAMIGKISGPVGTYAHSPLQVELDVANHLGMYLDPGTATQVVARDGLAAYASALAGVVAACGRIATDFRLMAARGEAHEQFGPDQVGSSSMPHKRNPITAEKICGMVRLARGYAAMLQPVDLWEDRDISHSCVERVALPDLLHTVCHALRCTADLVANARWDTGAMDRALKAADRVPFSAWKVLDLVREGMPRQVAQSTAAAWAREGCFGTDHDHPSALDLMANHPVLLAIDDQLDLDTEASRRVG